MRSRDQSSQATEPAARQPGLFDSLCDTQPLLAQSFSGSFKANRTRSLKSAKATPTSQAATLEQAHLRAAKRLSRAIRAQKADRAKQVMTGNAICQHLLAVLEASELDSDVEPAATGKPTRSHSDRSQPDHSQPDHSQPDHSQPDH
ncbi:MAG: hypothetical protein ACR2PZ_04465 [Pseudomonadales bacterium]